MRFFLTSFAILLALVAFSPTPTMAKGGGGGAGEAEAEEAGEAKAEVIRAAGSRASGSMGPAAGTQYEASPNQGGTRDAGTTANQRAGEQVNPQSSDGAGAAATADSWRYRSDNGRWWYWTPQNRWMWYGDDGQWVDYEDADSDAAEPYVVARPIVAIRFPKRPSPAARSRLPIRPRTRRPSAIRSTASPIRSCQAIAKTFVKIGLGQSSSAAAQTWIRPNTGSSRACTRLPARTTVGNCTAASCDERKER